MTARHEDLLTWSLAILCLVLALASRWPHLQVRTVPLEHIRPPLTVAIDGEVVQPGVYELPWGSRVEDLIAAAGGFSWNAEPRLVNLADPLSAGEKVVVPGVQSSLGEGRVNLNSASLLELETLPGVGPATAQKIIAGRPYARLEDILRVSGIGERTLERLRPLVTL